MFLPGWSGGMRRLKTMANKSNFFTTKRSNSGTTILSLRGEQVASIWKDNGKFVVACVRNTRAVLHICRS